MDLAEWKSKRLRKFKCVRACGYTCVCVCVCAFASVAACVDALPPTPSSLEGEPVWRGGGGA